MDFEVRCMSHSSGIVPLTSSVAMADINSSKVLLIKLENIPDSILR